MSRRKREGEAICRCGAYRFPHRFSGGRCWGVHLAEEAWECSFGRSGECRSCNHMQESDETNSCNVLDGRERIWNCPVWTEYVNDNEINLQWKGDENARKRRASGLHRVKNCHK